MNLNQGSHTCPEYMPTRISLILWTQVMFRPYFEDIEIILRHLLNSFAKWYET